MITTPEDLDEFYDDFVDQVIDAVEDLDPKERLAPFAALLSPNGSVFDISVRDSMIRNLSEFVVAITDGAMKHRAVSVLMVLNTLGHQLPTSLNAVPGADKEFIVIEEVRGDSGMVVHLAEVHRDGVNHPTLGELSVHPANSILGALVDLTNAAYTLANTPDEP